MAWLTRTQVEQIGFAAVGDEVLISDKCSIYGAAAISIGSHVRIDDFTIITAREPVRIGSYIHISAFVFLAGQFGITVEDFANVSPRATLLSGNDDFSGASLPGPLVPAEMRNVQGAPIHLARFSLLGAQSIVLPGVTMPEGAVVGALSLVKESPKPWTISAGVPARFIRERRRDLVEMARTLTPAP
jgi:galactoside O-acetyltransferase